MRTMLMWKGPFTDLDDPEFQSSKGLYMFIDADGGATPNTWVSRKCLYLGMTYYQTFRDEIRAKLNGAVGDWMRQNLRGTLVVKLAQVGIDGRISEELVKDIEGILIYNVQPPANIQGKDSYSGRLPIYTWNRGNPKPLPSFVGAEQGESADVLVWVPAT